MQDGAKKTRPLSTANQKGVTILRLLHGDAHRFLQSFHRQICQEISEKVIVKYPTMS